MFIAMIVVFVLGYTAIALEHPLKIDKAASALVTSVIVWVLLILGASQILPGNERFHEFLAINPDVARLPQAKQFIQFLVNHEIIEHLGEISEILFFLWGAMTIVETVDTHQGFRIITDRIKTKNKVSLLWLLSILTFFMSAMLDNLTTTIVMVTLLNKLIKVKKDRWLFASMIVIAANAGGAWSPIGDVTTIMLWIGGQVTTLKIIVGVFVESLVNMIIPLTIVSFMIKGKIEAPDEPEKVEGSHVHPTTFERKLLLFTGVGALLFVPVFKTVTHLPPYIGMLFGLGVIWIMTDIMHRKANWDKKSRLQLTAVLKKIDAPTIFFFLGILSAVAALESAGHLHLLASYLDEKLHNIYLIDIAIGFLSSIVDNVPLVAGGMGMYPIQTPESIALIADPAAQEYARFFVQDGLFWEFLAYTAGTGGSILIIGSAAGVAAMGLEKIDFIWYMKRISLLALSGYLAGALVYFLRG
ncbi:MAG: sodium:proton antiporter [Chlorobi bacterium]|nr:sodium:proton antiporter [Chlorobiota bacterium]